MVTHILWWLEFDGALLVDEEGGTATRTAARHGGDFSGREVWCAK